MRYIRLAALLLALSLLAGCSIVPFQTPEEQRAAQEAAQARKEESEAQTDPADALEGEFNLTRTLTNSAGLTLATYQATFPRFSETGLKGQSFARVNSYYSSEISGLAQDAESFFKQVRSFYGEEWDTVTELATPFAVSISYELLEAPSGYVCVQTTVSVAENGQKETDLQAQVFLLDNGWRLSLETLLGSHYEEAAPRLLADILAWCKDKGIQVTATDTRTLEEFSENYALTRDGFRFYVDPFALSNKNANRYVIPVSLDGYRQMVDN